ncbi:hypothetical protein DFH08DRAFT_799085 [Mycena albidolilacea]|uniref:Uncharacterized protein n=1 Tax=Mycena albidolilacea TaxID=1033008 RepID=A0AAD7APV2_9AGAR|nr:hypothetical protein DFH08DRAFT_799085 [Mycena albidolilacea]
MLGRKSESKLNRKPIPPAVSIPGIVPPCFDTSTDSNNSNVAATGRNRYRSHGSLSARTLLGRTFYMRLASVCEALACDYPWVWCYQLRCRDGSNAALVFKRYDFSPILVSCKCVVDMVLVSLPTLHPLRYTPGGDSITLRILNFSLNPRTDSHLGTLLSTPMSSMLICPSASPEPGVFSGKISSVL